MKLARLSIQGISRLCLIRDNQFLPVFKLSGKYSDDLCDFLTDLHWETLKQQADKHAEWQPLPTSTPSAVTIKANQNPAFGWLPCLSETSRIFCIGKNYLDHAKEMTPVSEASTIKADPTPNIFVRFPSSFTAHNGNIYCPASEDTFDYEGELAVIIGKAGKNISEEQALDHVFGYTIANDGTIRRAQKQTSQFTLGKNFDLSGALGPTITHSENFDIKSPHTIKTFVNGDIKQDGSTQDMLFSIEKTINAISQGTSLKPGDIILTGTPAGVGAGRTPPEYLQAGDQVAIKISGLDPLFLTVKANSD
jgi:2-keto-4-pentenoate hydratase/2-oxohepta-3-ene-1,7-dioic acid hydratase in catechol pathway